MMRNDVGLVTYGGEDTAPNVTEECREYPCDQHYVVRVDGRWVRAFHDERDAHYFADAMTGTINAERTTTYRR